MVFDKKEQLSLLFLWRFSKTLSKEVTRLVDYYVPGKPVMGKPWLFLSLKTLFPIKEYNHFTVKNYENSETFLREQTKIEMCMNQNGWIEQIFSFSQKKISLNNFVTVTALTLLVTQQIPNSNDT